MKKRYALLLLAASLLAGCEEIPTVELPNQQGIVVNPVVTAPAVNKAPTAPVNNNPLVRPTVAPVVNQQLQTKPTQATITGNQMSIDLPDGAPVVKVNGVPIVLPK